MTELDALRELIRREMNELADIVATGGATDWANYQRQVGTIDGLAVAERFLLDVKQRSEEQ